MASDNQIHELLQNSQTVAIVGLSDDPARPSHAVARFLQRNGYHIIPVNPKLSNRVLGEIPVANLRSIHQPVDIVCVFRRPEFVGDVVADAIEIGAGAVWMQLGIVDAEAAQRAERAGLTVVMDRCMAIEHRRLSRYASLVA